MVSLKLGLWERGVSTVTDKRGGLGQCMYERGAEV